MPERPDTEGTDINQEALQKGLESNGLTEIADIVQAALELNSIETYEELLELFATRDESGDFVLEVDKSQLPELYAIIGGSVQAAEETRFLTIEQQEIERLIHMIHDIMREETRRQIEDVLNPPEENPEQAEDVRRRWAA